MKRIATPMIGGVVTSTIMELMVYPPSSTCGARSGSNGSLQKLPTAIS